MTTTPDSTTERTAIAATLETDLTGARSGLSEDLKPAFHPLATICGHLGEDTIAEPIAFFYDWHDENGAAPDLTAEITAIDVAGTIATARMEIDNWTGHRFTDMFTLLKTTDAGWQITAKVFHLHA